MDIQRYNRQLANQILHNQLSEVHRENVLHGGGSYKTNSKPLPIIGTQQPSFETPTSGLTHSGGALKMPKYLKDLGQKTYDHVAPAIQHNAKQVANYAVKKGKYAYGEIKPVAKQHAKLVADYAVDRGVNYVNSQIPKLTGYALDHIDHAIPGGAVKRKRGRPRKIHNDVENAGKINFIKTMKSVGKSAMPMITKEVIKMGVKKLPSLMASSAPEVAEGAGIKKRKVSNRNLLVKKIMKDSGCTLAQASAHIKHHNLKY
jgi:hypothetical protein